MAHHINLYLPRYVPDVHNFTIVTFIVAPWRAPHVQLNEEKSLTGHRQWETSILQYDTVFYVFRTIQTAGKNGSLNDFLRWSIRVLLFGYT